MEGGGDRWREVGKEERKDGGKEGGKDRWREEGGIDGGMEG